MAYITFQPSDYFNSVLWTGNNDTVGATRSITGVGFAPDWIWSKNRTDTILHSVFDKVRGAGNTKLIKTNSTDGETGNTNAALYGYVSSFDNDGFTMTNGTDTGGNAGVLTQRTGHNYVAWNWRANGSGSANTDGSISSTVSANTTSGFSIAQWTGTGSNATIGHGLGVTPKCFIIKKTSGTSAWSMYHESIGNTKFMTLNATSDPTVSSTVWNNTSPTSSVFSVGTADNGNASGATYIGYFFAEKKGYSKFGSYTGNGNANGSFIYTGFKPAFFLYKQSSASGQNWTIHDNKRIGYNPVGHLLHPDLSNAESNQQSGSLYVSDFLSNGIKIRGTDSNINANAGTYIYMAFAEEPLVSSNNIPATAR